jgi:uncharacterized membrane protein YgdD (TMEM256/DUF423 family)
MEKTFLLLASLFGGLSVALGAFGAHAMSGRFSPSLLATYETAVRYQFYHALALIAVVVVLGRWPQMATLTTWAGWLFVAGIVIFSGSLYILVFGGLRWMGAITPIGGVAFITGWLLLAWVALRS